ncbi:MAG TPA: chemotaxis protein CheW [Gammaproteobacteria bacterium]|nr:chemotaxis protein CheW [Gammaproteobacteria bacterium]
MTAEPEKVSPFELLLDQERRASADASGGKPGAEHEWTGLLCRIKGDRVLAPMSMLKEIVPPPAFAHVPGTKSWIRGLANMHGSLVTVVDLQGFLFGENIQRGETGRRLLVVSDAGHKLGLLVNEVFGMRHFRVGDEVRETPTFSAPLKPYITAALKRQDDHFAVLNLQKLLNSAAFQDIAV